MKNGDHIKPSSDRGKNTGNDITFFMQVCASDQTAALANAEQIRKVYPDSRILICSDGAKNQYPGHWPGYFIESEELFGWQHGGKVVHRMLCLWEYNPTDFLIKVDWDTYIKDKFFLPHPSLNIIFGTLNRDGVHSLQGGFIGFTKTSASEMLHSQLFLSPRLISMKGVRQIYRKALEKEKNIPSYRHTITVLDGLLGS